ncbi:hypothetical protein ACFSOV_02680 [Pedobacter petrophilus]|nr:lipase family protein [Pedobacter petrophilus]
MRFKLILALFFFPSLSFAQKKQTFHKGFDAWESNNLLQLSLAYLDTTAGNRFIDYLPSYRFLYRSKSIGLDNAYDLWVRTDSTIVITLRGTTADSRSLLADFYCAMVPAKGKLVLGKNDTFEYNLAKDDRAAVHAGFLLGFGFLSRDIGPKIDSLYQRGFHNYLVAGHSQGGALCYYVSAWMMHLKDIGKYPLLAIKTYSSASPKMANTYFVYDYDSRTRSEWTYSIINTADVVPEMPPTTQQIEQDMNTPNPLMALYQRMDGLPFLKRILLKRAFNKMRKGSQKASLAYQKYLGGYTEKIIQKAMPEIDLPSTVNTTYFQRPGVPVTLQTNPEYDQHFKINDGPYFHHGLNAYQFLLEYYYPEAFQ